MNLRTTSAIGVISAAFVGVACGSDTTATDGTSGEAGGFVVTVSGEDLSVIGYDWSSGSRASGDPPAFVDGWALSFEHVIVTVSGITLNEDPDLDPANPMNVGAVVASDDRAYAVDVTIGGDIIGKSGSPDERTALLTSFPRQASGAAFDPTARYAFRYDLVTATSDAQPVNLDEEGRALYQEAIGKGWSTIYTGVATYRGPTPDAGSVFAKIPRTVKFKLGFKNPSRYANCRNTDLRTAGGEFPRGLQPAANREETTTAQITIHTDHAFWDRLNIEGTPLHFDPIAAQASTYGDPASTGEVTIEDLEAVDVTAFTTRSGEPLPARSLVPDYRPAAGQLAFDPNGTMFASANSFASYLSYSAASGGHMNAYGECEVQNKFTP